MTLRTGRTNVGCTHSSDTPHGLRRASSQWKSSLVMFAALSKCTAAETPGDYAESYGGCLYGYAPRMVWLVVTFRLPSLKKLERSRWCVFPGGGHRRRAVRDVGGVARVRRCCRSRGDPEAVTLGRLRSALEARERIKLHFDQLFGANDLALYKLAMEVLKASTRGWSRGLSRPSRIPTKQNGGRSEVGAPFWIRIPLQSELRSKSRVRGFSRGRSVRVSSSAASSLTRIEPRAQTTTTRASLLLRETPPARTPSPPSQSRCVGRGVAVGREDQVCVAKPWSLARVSTRDARTSRRASNDRGTQRLQRSHTGSRRGPR